MSGAIAFTIPGRIGGKGRPRFSRTSGRAYTPSKTVSEEALIRHYAQQAMWNRKPIEVAVALDIRVFRNTPASWSRKRKSEAHWVTGKPDADNTVKLASDSMNGIVYGDDAQIASVHFERQYRDGEQERVEVIVTPLVNVTENMVKTWR